jgi:hypothetical protein
VGNSRAQHEGEPAFSGILGCRQGQVNMQLERETGRLKTGPSFLHNFGAISRLRAGAVRAGGPG